MFYDRPSLRRLKTDRLKKLFRLTLLSPSLVILLLQNEPFVSHSGIGPSFVGSLSKTDKPNTFSGERGPRYFATTEVRCIHLVAKTPLNSSPWISKSKNDCFALKCNLLMEHTLFIWSVPSSSDSSMSVNLTGAQPKLYLAVWPQQLLPNPQRAMCVNGGALMWKLFICYDTENIHKYHNNILYLLLGPFFFFFFFFHKWRDVASSVSAFRETCYFFKKRFKK